MAHVITLSLTDGSVAAVTKAFSNLEKAMKAANNFEIDENYMQVYRQIRKTGVYTWRSGNNYYYLTKLVIE